MNKFLDAKAPLTMLKTKMQLKASKIQAFAVFKDEIENVTNEQSKFQDKIEYEIAVADAMDPVQVSIFCHSYVWHLFLYIFTGVELLTSSCTLSTCIVMATCACVFM